jgi:tryptophan synthase alpha chain
MTYYNPPFAMGLRRFCEAAAAAGVDGFIIPDLPPEEAGPLAAEARSRGLDLVLLAAPTSTPARLKRVAALASGFVYFVSVAGITGQNKGFDVQLGQAIAALRKASPLPVAIGFGISTPERALEACGLADGVVSASAVLQPVLEGQGVAAGLAVARALIEATHSAPA